MYFYEYSANDYPMEDTTEEINLKPAEDPMHFFNNIVFLQNDGQIGFQFVRSIMEIFIELGY